MVLGVPILKHFRVSNAIGHVGHQLNLRYFMCTLPKMKASITFSTRLYKSTERYCVL